MKKKSNTGLWVALGVGGYVGLWVLAALMGWTSVIYFLIVLTAAVAAGGIAALFMRGRAKRQARKLEREQRLQAGKEPATRTAAPTAMSLSGFLPSSTRTITSGTQAYNAAQNSQLATDSSGEDSPAT